ncbi:glycosyltransferase family 2 protein [Microbacterium sp. NPDC077663]|uniref:glycosyltransferase family 2 protein n=1 Tax=Microbacterium sp. NPDC077663 TaxID=3364189 RepID=UPI0037C513F7
MNSRAARSSTALVIAVWVALVVPLVTWAAESRSPLAVAFAVASALTWVAGGRALALWVRASSPRRAESVGGGTRPDRIALLVCVCDDLDAAAVVRSARQDVPVDVVLLDDSRDPGVMAQVDALASARGWRVLRRTDRSGFKAGNLNAGIARLRGRYDAYLVCDSDVVLDAGVARVCAAALADPAVAVAQASPAASPGRSRFARYFGPLLATHLAVTRRGRAAHGVTAFLGRGALVRAAAIDDVGGFPDAVAEDLAMTVRLRRRGWRIVDADVAFTEDYPIDYAAFRVQLRKTAEGAVEFLRHPERMRELALREGLDLGLETALVPVTALAGAIALTGGAALAGLGTPPPVWVMVVSAVAALAPLLPEAVRRARTRRLAAGLVFALAAGLLYTSVTFVVLAAVIRTVLGRRATFWVTPKSRSRRRAVALLRDEIVLVPLLAVGAIAASGSLAAAAGPAMPAAVAALFAWGALRGHARTHLAAPLAPRRRRGATAARRPRAVAQVSRGLPRTLAR